MTAVERVRAHYDAVGLLDRVRGALAGIPTTADGFITPADLAGLDQFHTRGLSATLDLARLTVLLPGESVLDLGCGLGGPARIFASQFGANVQGIDLSVPFIEAGRYLNARCDLERAVTLHVGNATVSGFPSSTFDAVFLQHVAMNIADRPTLYREVKRMLKPNGRFATFDVVAGDREVVFPLPWSREPATNHLLSMADTQAAIEAAGLKLEICRDDTASAIEWFSQLASGGPPPALNLGIVMGPEVAVLAGTLGRNLREGRARILTAVARKPRE